MLEFENKIPVFDLAKRHLIIEKRKITAPENAVPICRELIGDKIDVIESFFIIMLDNSNSTIGCACIGVGGINGVNVDVRLILHYAAACLASSIILVHNHPSGALTASEEDVKITRDVSKIMLLARMPVVDHLILTPDGFLSFAHSGLLNHL
jgi:DNA repair protein RadC